MIRIGITDDHPLIIDGLKALLDNDRNLNIVGSWNSLNQTRIALKSCELDVLLLDLNLPDGDGIQFCEVLKTEQPQIKILVLSSYDSAPYIRQSLKKGASGYLLKNVSAEELLNAIHAVNEGQQYLQNSLKDLFWLENSGKTGNTGMFNIRLTRREKEVLELIASSYTTAQIADKLNVSVKTVETHRSHLMEKLGTKNSVGLIKEAIERGLL